MPDPQHSYQFHEAAALFPMMSDSEIDELTADVREHGLHQPILRHEGKILDGRNRLEACKRAGVTPRFIEWDGSGGSPTSFVLSANLKRRHLDSSQRAMIAARAKPLFEEEARERMLAGKAQDPRANLPEGRARDQAAALVNVSTRSVEFASKVIRDGVPELIDAADRGDVAVSAAAEIAHAPKETQLRIVAGGRPAMREKAKEIRNASRAMGGRAKKPHAACNGVSSKSADVILAEPNHDHDTRSIANLAMHALKETGSLLFITTPSALQVAMTELARKLTYHHAIALGAPSRDETVEGCHITSQFKLALWFSAGKPHVPTQVHDLLLDDGADARFSELTDLHQRQLARLLAMFISDGDHVLAPFSQTDGLAIAVKKLGAHLVSTKEPRQESPSNSPAHAPGRRRSRKEDNAMHAQVEASSDESPPA